MDVDSDNGDGSDSGDEDKGMGVPELSDIFTPGQYVRTIVTTVHPLGVTADSSGLGKSRDEMVRASRRVELSLVPEQVNTGLQKADLKSGFVSSLFSLPLCSY